jgi:hypothetical protein
VDSGVAADRKDDVMFRRLIKGKRQEPGPANSGSLDEQILRILDDAAADFVFPALDNGYVYPAATRLSAHRSDDDWALVIEVFGFSPRAMDPDVFVTTFASRIHDPKSADDFVDAKAFENYQQNHPHDFQVAYFPIDDAWKDQDDLELVSSDATAVTVRGLVRSLPPIEEYARRGITLEDPPRVRSFELCRYLADDAHDDVLATEAERRTHVPQATTEILVLDEWHHPDVVGDERPSSSETFRQLAKVLATGNPAEYRPTMAPNTHWANWPEGGTL